MAKVGALHNLVSLLTVTASQHPQKALLWIRVIAFFIAGISIYLLIQKAIGKIDSLAGCGGSNGCSQVIGGPWSTWFLIPVTAIAATMYCVVFFISFPSFSRRNPRVTAIVLRASATCALGAALWFLSILIFYEKEFCTYCVATHLLGLTFTVIVFFVIERSSLPRTGMLPYALGATSIAVLTLGQLFGPRPDSHEIVNVEEVIFHGSKIRIKTNAAPKVGTIDAEHYILEFFDYTCGSCRIMHGDLKALQKSHPNTFTILYLPCPLNRKCNKFLPTQVKDHQNACELAQSALAVWQADPKKFYEMHDHLMSRPLPISLSSAKSKAISLVGQKAYEKAMASPIISEILDNTFENYKQLAATNPKMPILLLGQKGLMRGVAKDTKTFVSEVAKFFGLTSAK